MVANHIHNVHFMDCILRILHGLVGRSAWRNCWHPACRHGPDLIGRRHQHSGCHVKYCGSKTWPWRYGRLKFYRKQHFRHFMWPACPLDPIYHICCAAPRNGSNLLFKHVHHDFDTVYYGVLGDYSRSLGWVEAHDRSWVGNDGVLFYFLGSVVVVGIWCT